MSDYQGNIIIKNPATPTGPFQNGSAPGVWKLSEVLPFVRQGIWPTQGIQGKDPFFSNVSLLLSTTALGNANNNLFVDSSGAFNPVSRFGNTTQGSFTPYSSSWSNYFDGNGDYLGFPNNAALQMGSGDFTVEAWVFLNSYNASYGSIISTSSNSSGSNGLGLIVSPAGAFRFFSFVSTSYVATGATIPLGQWTHVAATRASGTLRLFVNGTLSATASNSDNFNGDTSGGGIGGWVSFNQGGLDGNISNLRMVKGTALYTANFTVPTAPLTAVSGTSLLTCQSNRFIDNSGNAFTITSYGNAAVQDFNPFPPTYPGLTGYNQNDITNWSGYFDGSGDYLTVADNTAFSYGTGAFTIECWVYASGLGATRRLYYHITTSATQVTIYQLNTNYVGFYASNAGTPIIDILSNTLLPANAWTHIAVVRNGNTFTLYQNGASVATGTSASSMPDPTGAVNIGALDNGGEAWLGYISNLRAVKGTAVYTGNFTPPTTNLTAISGTSLLTLQNAAFTDNSTNNFVITPFGNTTVTGNSPFNTTGYWSNYFLGTAGNYLSAPNNAAFQFGTGDVTIESWIYITGDSVASPDGNRHATICAAIGPTGISNDFWFYVKGNSTTTGTGLILRTYNSGSEVAVFNTTYSFNKNTWYHVALSRSGNNMYLFIDGALHASTTYAGAITAGTNPLNIGYAQTGGVNYNSPFFGYLSNLRIVKGSAVYTSAFTVPTSPLTAISGTSILTCQNGRFVDNSTNAFAITQTGSISVQSFDPFYTATIASNGGSMYFDGNGDYVSIPNGPSMVLSGGTYTLEAWVYPTGDRSAYRTIFVKRAGDPTPCAWQVSLNVSTGNLVFYNGTLYNSGVAVPLNAWSHVAAVYDGTNINLYLNGSRVLQSATSNVDCNANVQIGYFFSSVQEPFIGYIANARILKGVQAYTGTSYTVPTAPANPTAATVLMVNGMNAGIYDATTINDMETAGNAQVRYPSPFAPANYWAGAFDGSGDYISVPASSSLTLGTGDFTIEMWLYSGANSTSTRLAGNGAGAGWGANKWVMGTGYAGSANKFFMSVNNGGTLLTSTTTFNDSAWHHAAVTRSGNTWRLFVDGVQEATLTSSVSVDGGIAANISIGSGQISGDADWAGSISNFRIVKGTAVYTANFTPSTTPLTAISGTSLLTCQNKTFIDNSSNAFTITAFGNATAGAIGPFTATGGTSVYFDGTGDSGRIAVNQPALQFGTSNFTAEGWVCPTSTGVTNQHILTGGTSWTTGSGGIYIYSSGGVITLGAAWNQLPANPAVVSGALAPNTWYHFALVRNGNTLTLYINGTSVSTYNVSGYTLAFNNQSRTNIGGGGWDNDFGGYIDDLRVTNGVARYTANFTPPTQPFPIY